MYKKRIKGSRKFNERMERARAEREHRRLEGTAPDYPPELPELRCRIVVEVFDSGGVVRHELKLYRSSRIDCYVVVVDGKTAAGADGTGAGAGTRPQGFRQGAGVLTAAGA